MTAEADLYVDPAALFGEHSDFANLEWRLSNLYWVVDKQGECVRFKPNAQQLHLIRNLWNKNLVLKARQLGFCLDPSTRVLKADLTWHRIDALKLGDEVVAVDEDTPGGRGAARKMRTATIQAIAERTDKAYRITFHDGRSVVCSGKHRWLSRKVATDAEWRMVEDGKGRLTVGTKVRWVTKPWKAPTVEDGWFGGMLDGEGSMALPSRTGASVCVAQREGPVWDRLQQYAADRGYAYRMEADAAERPSKFGSVPVPKLCFTRMDELFRLIGQTRPTRFLARRWWEGKDMPGKRTGEAWATIVSIEPLPEQRLIDLQTSTGTFIAEGFVSHNSTLMQLLQLDQAIFLRNFNGVVIADTLPNAKKLFSKVEFAYDHLPDVIRQAVPVHAKTKGEGLEFAHEDAEGKANPSRISIAVSARGGTVNLLHVSELGKIGLKFPQRAEEIKTGAFPAAEQGITVVESTAEGAFGLFYDLCEPAMKRLEAGTPETRLDWRLHFFPWYECDDYRLTDEEADIVEIPDTLRKYFAKIQAELRIKLDRGQRAWYAKMSETLGKKMKQEYPATPKEAFEQAIEGAVYGDQMTRLREQGRLGRVPLDPNYPVNTFWDFGVNDATAIWFHQHIGLQHRWFYYREGSGKGLRHWWIDVCEAHRQRHGYRWGTHYLPHDADAEILGEVVTTKRRILGELGMESIKVVPRVATISQGIELTRTALGGNHWFDDHKPDEDNGEDMGAGNGIRCLDGYQFEWDDKRGIWSAEPLHNWASHGADAWRQFAQGYSETSSLENEDDDDRRPRRRNWKTS